MDWKEKKKKKRQGITLSKEMNPVVGLWWDYLSETAASLKPFCMCPIFS